MSREKSITAYPLPEEFGVLIIGYQLVTWKGIESRNGVNVISANFCSTEEFNSFNNEFIKVHSKCPFCINKNIIPNMEIELTLSSRAIKNLHYPIEVLRGLPFEFGIILMVKCNSETCTVETWGVFPDLPHRVRDRLNVKFTPTK